MKRLWFILLAIPFGVWLSFAYINPYGGTITLSELVLQLSGARGTFALGLNLSELLDLTLRLVGTKGNIYVDYFSPNNEVYAPGERIYSYYAEDKDQMMIDDLIQCYQEGRPFGITGEDGRDCALVAEAAYRSLKAKAPVRL